MRDHPDLSVRQAEGVSLARALGINYDEVSAYFNLLENLLVESNLFGKSAAMFSNNRNRLQLNNNPGELLAEKGSFNIYIG